MFRTDGFGGVEVLQLEHQEFIFLHLRSVVQFELHDLLDELSGRVQLLCALHFDLSHLSSDIHTRIRL